MTIEERTAYLCKKMRRRKILKTSLIALLVGAVIGSAVGLTIATVVKSNKEYELCIEYPPDTNWVEEDLEPIFMTTGVCCLDWKQEENHTYYDVSANGFYYRCHYAIHRSPFGLPHWKYINHIQINWLEE